MLKCSLSYFKFQACMYAIHVYAAESVTKMNCPYSLFQLSYSIPIHMLELFNKAVISMQKMMATTQLKPIMNSLHCSLPCTCKSKWQVHFQLSSCTCGSTLSVFTLKQMQLLLAASKNLTPLFTMMMTCTVYLPQPVKLLF